MKDRVIVITGASAGIGAALARQLGAKGAKLALAARREDALAEVAAESGADALVVPTDVTLRAEVERLRDAAIARFGRVDAWVNNAGRGINRQVSELTDADLDEMMTVNVKSALYGMQAALAPMKAQGAGHIVNVSSMLGRVPYVPMRSAYSASKHALNALTANLRMELRDAYPGIVVSTVSPGPVATDFGTSVLHGGPDSRSMPGAQTADEVAAVIVDVLERPRADVYTRPDFQARVAAYYAADDMAAAERPPR
ncbi:MAG: SDR family NAD(P)-dependent oxidoreductase [Myxococcales bacterium]|nr:SDR family NAD(P)-dependent oxidoreductase [Myxococcales bacterium]MCB9735502.1 SDR family NAD(P)-dependent oxidoreductase [Deltaproteobacteria bacterium]